MSDRAVEGTAIPGRTSYTTYACGLWRLLFYIQTIDDSRTKGVSTVGNNKTTGRIEVCKDNKMS